MVCSSYTWYHYITITTLVTSGLFILYMISLHDNNKISNRWFVHLSAEYAEHVCQSRTTLLNRTRTADKMHHLSIIITQHVNNIGYAPSFSEPYSSAASEHRNLLSATYVGWSWLIASHQSLLRPKLILKYLVFVVNT